MMEEERHLNSMAFRALNAKAWGLEELIAENVVIMLEGE